MAEYVKGELPFGRFGRADELGDVVAFLASSRASWISGTAIVVDGCQSRAIGEQHEFQAGRTLAHGGFPRATLRCGPWPS
jgi:hypothetical protein